MFVAAQAEQQIIARRAERAWMIAEAELQGQFTRRPGAVSRLKLLIARIAGLASRSSADPASVPPVVRRRSANAG